MNKKTLLIIPIILFLTACYNYQELNDLKIVSAISISMINNEYEVTIETINPKKDQDSKESNKSDYTIYKKKDETVQLAFRKILETSPKKLYGDHINLLILDESIARKSLKNILDFFAREPKIRNEFYVLIGKNKDILSNKNISSKSLLDSLKINNSYLGYTNLITFNDLMDTYLNPYKELAIPSIEITTNNNQTNIISEIAIFKQNKLIGYLEEKDALIYNIITGNAKTFLIKTNNTKKEYTINEILREITTIKINTKKKEIQIIITGTSSLSETNINKPLDNINTINQIQKELNKTIEKSIKTSISNTINKYKTDIYNFQDIFYKEKPTYIKNLKENWTNTLKKINIKVTSNIKIVEKGNLNGGIKDE